MNHERSALDQQDAQRRADGWPDHVLGRLGLGLHRDVRRFLDEEPSRARAAQQDAVRVGLERQAPDDGPFQARGDGTDPDSDVGRLVAGSKPRTRELALEGQTEAGVAMQRAHAGAPWATMPPRSKAAKNSPTSSACMSTTRAACATNGSGGPSMAATIRRQYARSMQRRASGEASISRSASSSSARWRWSRSTMSAAWRTLSGFSLTSSGRRPIIAVRKSQRSIGPRHARSGMESARERMRRSWVGSRTLIPNAPPSCSHTTGPRQRRPMYATRDSWLLPTIGSTQRESRPTSSAKLPRMAE